MTLYVGIDPGPTPGVVVLGVGAGLETIGVLQCSAVLLDDVLTGLTANSNDLHVVVEHFVTRGRATKDQSVTRDQVAWLERDYHARLRSAAQVKPWATDARLTAAGLLDACKGMRHARDAARHALFAAVYDGGLPDPLSKEFNR